MAPRRFQPREPGRDSSGLPGSGKKDVRTGDRPVTGEAGAARYDPSPMPDRSVSWGRLAAVVPVILGSGVLLALGAAVLAFAPRSRRRYREGLFRATCRCLLALLRAEVRVVGPPPRPPFLLAANHLSYLDILVLAGRLPVRVVAKAEVLRWPLLAPLYKGFGALSIGRSDRRDIPRVLAEIEAALARGEGVILFPEGTSSSGETVLPFRSPLLALPAR